MGWETDLIAAISGISLWLIGIVISAIIGIAFEGKFNLINKLKKRWAMFKNEDCRFSISTEFEADNKILDKIKRAFENQGFSIDLKRSGPRTVLTATNKKMEAFNVEISEEQVIRLEPVQTTLQNAIPRLEEWTAILTYAANKEGLKFKSISFLMFLPFNFGIDIRPPKPLSLKKYNIEFSGDRGTTVQATLDKGISVNSQNPYDLISVFKALIK